MIKLDVFGRKELVTLPPGGKGSYLIPTSWLFENSADTLLQLERLIVQRARDLDCTLIVETSFEPQGLLVTWSRAVG